MNDLHAVMDRALADLDVPTARLHDGAVRRGRATRRRRRLATSMGGVAVVAALTAVAVPAVSGDHAAEGSRFASEPSATPSAVTGTPSSYDPPSGWWDTPGREMRDRLAALLPTGLTITHLSSGNDELAPGESPHGGWLQVDVADAMGAAGGMNVVLYPPAGPDGQDYVQQQTTCPGNLVSPDACTEVHGPSGETVGRVARTAQGGVVVVEATRLTPDGAVVYVAASNSSDDKWGRGSSTDREAPPVTMADVRSMAGDPSWRR